MGREIGKAEGILANQREEQWRREGKTAEMREEGENRLKMERAVEREKGSGEKMGTARMRGGKRTVRMNGKKGGGRAEKEEREKEKQVGE